MTTVMRFDAVRTEGAMTERIRTLFAVPGTAPPVPSAAGDVAWEICGAMDVNELGLPYDVWTIEGERVVARLFGSRPEGELVYGFLSPDLASRAASEQASRCARGACGWLTSASVEGRCSATVCASRRHRRAHGPSS